MTQIPELTITELLKRLDAGQIPMSAKVTGVYEDVSFAAREENGKDTGDDKNPALALFEQWDKEDAEMTPEEQAQNERVYAQIAQNGVPRVRV